MDSDPQQIVLAGGIYWGKPLLDPYTRECYEHTCSVSYKAAWYYQWKLEENI